MTVFASIFSDMSHTQHDVSLQFAMQYGEDIDRFIALITQQLKQGRKILFAGNGGSACDAMHIAGEFVGRYKRERNGMAALALSADSGILTAVGNDYGYEQVFARQVEALGASGDILIALSTSGKSPNILSACVKAKERGMHVALFTGQKGKDATAYADHIFAYESTDTAIIQQCSMASLHLMADVIEQQMMNQ